MSGPQYPRPDTVPMPREETIWLTRDSDQFGAWDIVDVWYARPTMFRDTQGVYWLDDEGNHSSERHRLLEAAKRFRTLPDNERECVRIGR